MGGDKIVLLDGAGANGGGAAATNGLLSMIPGMFANLIGGNKMDPNLVAALMNGRNNQDGFGGANGWWLWIIVLFWLWGGRGFGNGFGNGGDCCANGLPAQLNNDYGRELLMQAIQGNRSAIDQIASALNCSTTQLQNAILYKMACRARLPRRKNKLEGSDLRSRSRSFRWCGSHSKKYDSRIPVFPVWKKRNKNIIPVGGQ